jgi:hypothetical protein
MEKKPLRHHKHVNQSSIIQNQFMQLSSLSIYQHWTDWQRIQENDSIYNSHKKTKYLEINLTKDVKDL